MFRKHVKATGKSKGEADRKAQEDLNRQAQDRGKKVEKPKTKGGIVSTKHGAFYLSDASGRLKKRKK